MSAFTQCFAIVVGTEGGYSLNRADPGNWTGNKVNAGELKGTKYGIAAGSHPALDIANLTLEQAQAIYQSEYWDKAACEHMHPLLALLVFDAAVNNGPHNAIVWLQTSVGVTADGIIGEQTLNALQVKDGSGAAVCAEFLAMRILYMASLPGWKTFGRGWSRRLARLPYQSLTLGAS